MSNGIELLQATPGTSVPSGALVTPGGQQGPPGSTGNTGVQGPPGPAGTTVATTTSLNFTQPAANANVPITLSSATGISAGLVLYIQGGGYYSVVSVAGNVATCQNLGYPTNASPLTVINSGAAVGGSGPIGPQGPTGSQGIQGPTGPAGTAGAQGPQGPQGTPGATGSPGAPGTAATIAVGTTTTGAAGSAAAVTNSGSSSAAVFNFTVPQGIQGIQGVQGTAGAAGTQGPQGDPGATGPAGSQGPAGPTAISSNANNKATLGSDSLTLVQGTAAGVAATTHAQTVSGDDPQLTNARVPTAHAATHKSGGSDLIALDTLGATTDITTLNASTTAHGLMPKATNSATTFYASDATQKAVPYSSLSGTPATFAPTAHQVSHVTGADQIPAASASQRGLLSQLSGNTTDFVDGTNACQNLVTAIQPTIWSVRLRSFNTVGNPNFEVDQRNVGATMTLGAATWALDRWQLSKNAGTTMAATGFQSAGPVLLPGTNFPISSKFLRVTLTAAQASLGASDMIGFNQTIEGAVLRELISDVHSASLLVRSSVAGLKFGFALRDSANVRSLTKLCTIPSANVWTLITLPNLPVWAAGGTFLTTPGSAGYFLSVTLLAGSTFIPGANDTWQTGNFVGALGQDNFAASAVNSTFDLAMVQHEPGPVCSTLIDCPFGQNYDGPMGCLRYFQKSYSYGTAIGATGAGQKTVIATGAITTAFGPMIFPKIMAKTPTITLYNGNTGAANSVRDNNGTDHTGASVTGANDSGFTNIAFSTATTGAMPVYFNYTADTGW